MTRDNTRGSVSRPVVRIGSAASTHDYVAVEEPLEIRVAGETIAITMRTPGRDRQLAIGFLSGEGIVGSIDDVGGVVHCGRPGTEGYGNVIDVIAAAGVTLDVERVESSRRGTLTTASCGVCGRKTIEDLIARCRPQHDDVVIEARRIGEGFEQMRDRQTLFAQTGGIHAAGIVDTRAGSLVVDEDVGRHNAVDKVIGQLVFDRRLPAAGCVLLVSGRASFEMVQKAVSAKIPIVASVSAATSLAIDLARATGTTLIGFARGDRMNVYSGEARIKA